MRNLTKIKKSLGKKMLELKNLINEMKNSIETINSGVDQSKNKISDL